MSTKTGTEHTDYVCPGHDSDPHYRGYCQFCEGGLGACSVCGSFEGATTTHCPGYPMSEQTRDWVYDGVVDYRWGEWIDRPSRFSPAWWGKHRDRLALIKNHNGLMDRFGTRVKR